MNLRGNCNCNCRNGALRDVDTVESMWSQFPLTCNLKLEPKIMAHTAELETSPANHRILKKSLPKVKRGEARGSEGKVQPTVLSHSCALDCHRLSWESTPPLFGDALMMHGWWGIGGMGGMGGGPSMT